MKTKEIKISVETAREWYNQGGFQKELALQVFTEQELTGTITYDNIIRNILHSSDNGYLCTIIDPKIQDKLTAIIKLYNISHYFNCKCKFDKYYYTIRRSESGNITVVSTSNKCVSNFYFYRREDCQTAINMFSELELNYLFE